MTDRIELDDVAPLMRGAKSDSPAPERIKWVLRQTMIALTELQGDVF